MGLVEIALLNKGAYKVLTSEDLCINGSHLYFLNKIYANVARSANTELDMKLILKIFPSTNQYLMLQKLTILLL